MSKTIIQLDAVATPDGIGERRELKEGDKYYYVPEITEEQFKEDHASMQREERNIRLQESDWVTARSNETGQPIPDDWKTYRQALRDLPTHPKWPDLQESDWPTKPS